MTADYEKNLDPADTDPAGFDGEFEDDDLADDDVIGAEAADSAPSEAVLPADPAGEPVVETPMPAHARLTVAGTPPAAGLGPAVGDPGTPGAPFSAEQLSQEWREIQASFVDDPRGAVQMAAEAAESAMTTLMTSLRERQATLGPVAAQDTEQLRAALREYRKFCQGLAEAARRLTVS